MAKIQRSQLKEIIKECIMELVSDGSLNETLQRLSFNTNPQMLHSNQVHNQPKQLDPRVKSVAASVGKTPKERAMFESILSDTLETAIEQQSGEVDPQFWNQDTMNGLQGMNGNNSSVVQVPQLNQIMTGQYPQQQPTMNNGYGQQGYGGYQPQQPQQRQMVYGNGYNQQQAAHAGYPSLFAKLAFNSPISNRPQNGSGGGSAGFLPGVNTSGLQ